MNGGSYATSSIIGVSNPETRVPGESRHGLRPRPLSARAGSRTGGNAAWSNFVKLQDGLSVAMQLPAPENSQVGAPQSSRQVGDRQDTFSGNATWSAFHSPERLGSKATPITETASRFRAARPDSARFIDPQAPLSTAIKESGYGENYSAIRSPHWDGRPEPVAETYRTTNSDLLAKAFRGQRPRPNSANIVAGRRQMTDDKITTASAAAAWKVSRTGGAARGGPRIRRFG
eukprot:TRINITY_DN11480_c0_g1_i1.p1 TRINITY_DN11480_c0_g1~~TRINITY_DN11480_c0_g1_i1.p1  ORF type:complete len:231 (+),score=20.30 TRINITY_DN11480_c0_g1_i1:112-804(+)